MATAKKAAIKKVAAKKAAKVAKVAKAAAPKREKIESNGVVRPGAQTNCGKLWAIADRLSSKGKPAERAAVLEAAEKAEINPATAATQFQQWRTFMGVERTARVPKPPKAAKKAAAKKAAPAKKAAAKKTATKAAKSAPAAPAASNGAPPPPAV